MGNKSKNKTKFIDTKTLYKNVFDNRETGRPELN